MCICVTQVNINTYMKKFSQIIAESSKNKDRQEPVSPQQVQAYFNKVKKWLSVDIQKAIQLSAKMGLLSPAQIEEVRELPKSKVPEAATRMGVDGRDLMDLWNLLKQAKDNYKQMPQFLSDDDFQLIATDKIRPADLVVDLKSSAGRADVVKRYTPLVHKIVNQELPKHPNMDRSEMISAGLMGLTQAMNTWKSEPDEKTGKVVPFKTYAGYQILRQIQQEANTLYQTLSGRNYYNLKKDKEKYGSGVLHAVSLDGMSQDRDADDFSQDRLAILATADRPDSAEEEKKWNQIFKHLESKFSQKDMDIFYRYFGVNGRKRETGVQIAKSYNTTPVNINNGYLKKVLKYLRSNPAIRDILQDLADIYTEALMIEMIYLDRDMMIEKLASDDIYIFLVESTKWNSERDFASAILRVLKSSSALLSSTPSQKILVPVITGDFEQLDSVIRKHGLLLREFLSWVYPNRPYRNATDGDVIEAITELQEYCRRYKMDQKWFDKNL